MPRFNSFLRRAVWAWLPFLGFLFFLFLAPPAQLAAQITDFTKPLVNGIAVASEFGQWTMPATINAAGGGTTGTIVFNFPSITLPDSSAISPLMVGEQLLIHDPDSALDETITLQTVSCQPDVATVCSATADFAHAHVSGVTVSSATDGLFEAASYLSAHGGGTVLLTSSWTGQGNQIASLPGYANVLIHDIRKGRSNWYFVTNGSYSLNLQISSAGEFQARAFNGVLNAAQYPGSDIGAQVNAAEASCADAVGSGCEIDVPPLSGGYTYSTPINLVKYWVNLKCTRGQILYYTGTGDAVFVGEGSPGPYVQGSISGCIIDGSKDANANVNGIRQVNTTGFAYRNGVAVQNFTAPGDVALLWQNQPTAYTDGGICIHCSDGTQNERTHVGMVSLINNSTNWELQSVAGAGNSFEYSRVDGLHLQQNNGQTGILIDGNGAAHSASLMQSYLNIASNTNDPAVAATLIKVENGGEAYDDVWTFKSEETTGTLQIPYDVADPLSFLSFEANPNVALSGGGAGINNGSYFEPSTYSGNNVAPSTGPEYHPLLSFGGNTVGAMPGIESLGFSEPVGHNSNLVFGGNGLSGIGGVDGINIQHPYAWCYTLDTQCFEIDSMNGSQALSTIADFNGYGDLRMADEYTFAGTLYFGSGTSNTIAAGAGNWTGLSLSSPQNTTTGFNDRVAIQDARTGNFDLLANAYYNAAGNHYYNTAGFADRLWQNPGTDGFEFQCAPSGAVNTVISFSTCATISTSGLTVQRTLTAGGSLADQIVLTGTSSGNDVSASAAGVDSNINIALTPKGTGVVYAPKFTAGDSTAKANVGASAADFGSAVNTAVSIGISQNTVNKWRIGMAAGASSLCMDDTSDAFASPSLCISNAGAVFLKGASLPSGQTLNISGSVNGTGVTGAGAVVLASGAAVNAASLQVSGDPVSFIVASGTITVTPSATVGCTDTAIAAAGAALSMLAHVSPSSLPVADADTTWNAYVASANTVDIHICTIAAITPAAATYNWNVTSH